MEKRWARTGAVAEPSAQTLMAAALLIGALCAIYLVSQYLRISVGVIAPDIAADLALSPGALGILSSAFFLSFALAQIPLGAALDRYGPKRCMLASVGLAVAGTVLFGLADSLAGLVLARILMGLGCSSLLMGPLTIYTRWFSPRTFSTLAGFHIGIGTLGSLLATAPLALFAEWLGWRGSFLVVALITAGVGVLVALAVSDDPPGVERPAAQTAGSLLESVRGLGDVVRIPGFARLFALHMTAYSTFIAVFGLWGGPFVTDVLGFSLRERGNALLVLAITQIAGLFLWGPADRLMGSRRLPATIGALGTAATLLALAAFGDRGTGTVYGLFAVLGLVSAYVPVLLAQGRALFDHATVGRGMALLNFGTMSGVFIVQLVTGFIIGAFAPVAEGTSARPFAAYQAAFAFLGLILIASWLFYRTAPDHFSRHDETA